MIPWRRLFGLGLIDLYHRTSYRVELEKDLSLKQQFLDVAIIAIEVEQDALVELPNPPDGLDDLSRHNLLTCKSLREPLDAWAMDEISGPFCELPEAVQPFPGSPGVPVGIPDDRSDHAVSERPFPGSVSYEGGGEGDSSRGYRVPIRPRGTTPVVKVWAEAGVARQATNRCAWSLALCVNTTSRRQAPGRGASTHAAENGSRLIWSRNQLHSRLVSRYAEDCIGISLTRKRVDRSHVSRLVSAGQCLRSAQERTPGGMS